MEICHIDRQTTDTQSDRKIDRQMKRRHINRQTDEKNAHKQTDRQIHIQAERYTNKWTAVS